MKFRNSHSVLAVAVSMLAMASSAYCDNLRFAIFVMRVDGSQVRKLAEAEDHDDHGSPRWSHDGKQVAFDASSGPRGQRDFFVVNADGTNLRKLGGHARPDWSPDDKQLAYDVYSGRGLEIHVQGLDGTGQDTIAQGVCARWSPDGSQLAVTDHHNVRIVDLLSGDVRELFDEPYDNIYGGYNWSPDGKRLAVTAQTKAGGGGKRPLLLVNAQGARLGATVRMQGGQGGTVSFSPDGKQLVIDNKYLIQILNVDGTAAPRIVPGQQGKNKDPHWSPDGQWIVFSSDRHVQ